MVAEYLRTRGAAEHVVKSGLVGLIRSWERVVDEVESGSYQWGMEDRLNDIDIRTLVHEVVQALPGEVVLGLMRRLNLADWRFKEATLSAGGCVWGDDNARDHGWTRNTHWWLYRVPPTAEGLDPRD